MLVHGLKGQPGDGLPLAWEGRGHAPPTHPLNHIPDTQARNDAWSGLLELDEKVRLASTLQYMAPNKKMPAAGREAAGSF